MSSFTTPLITEEHDNGRLFRVDEPFTYWTDLPVTDAEIAASHGHLARGADGKVYITVEKGFITDMASVPRVFWFCIDAHGPHAKAAVVHDYLYQYRVVSKKFADLVFFEAMGVLGVNRIKKHIIFQAVNLFGESAWEDDAEWDWATGKAKA